MPTILKKTTLLPSIKATTINTKRLPLSGQSNMQLRNEKFRGEKYEKSTLHVT
jgi:hypothetical protein